MMAQKIFKGLLTILCFLYSSEIGYAAIINSDSCSQNDVQWAINSSSSGDTVIIPAGKCTWDSGVSIPSYLKITLQGSGFTKTIITRNGTAVDMNESGSRLTGIAFVLNSGDEQIVVQGTGWRIDNCRFINNTGQSRVSISVTGMNVTTLPTGLIDNNDFVQGRIVINGMMTFDKCSIEWAKPSILGTADSVYIEDNSFYKNVSSHGNVIDSNRAGSYVARFNTIGGTAELMVHGLQSDGERAGRYWEVYNNTFNADGYRWDGWVTMRGGTGIIFGNTISGDYSKNILLDFDRGFSSIGSAGQCDGSSSWDSNEAGERGWLCRDQPGSGPDTSLWTGGNPYPPQNKQPMYFFMNRTSGKISDVYIHNGCDNWIVANRDYYNEVTSFDGTSGVGYGTLASRPATCTKGVAYWATDQGSWNKSGSGGQGVLYRAISTNTWELYYTPYQYPHPLRTSSESSGPTEPPTTPSNPKVIQ